MPTKEENIASTESKISNLRTANMFGTAIGSAIAGAFGGWEAAGSAAKTTTKIIGDEYYTQIKELGRQESMLEEERRTNAMMAFELKKTKLSAYYEALKTPGYDPNKAASEILGVSGPLVAETTNKLLTTKFKNEKEYEQAIIGSGIAGLPEFDKVKSSLELRRAEFQKSKPGMVEKVWDWSATHDLAGGDLPQSRSYAAVQEKGKKYSKASKAIEEYKKEKPALLDKNAKIKEAGEKARRAYMN
ncbi:MAG: hypothetical protein NT030_06910 [Candidatus Saganbacteria bacterium]|nr:hypothetical protein [Candidatus Saganbacteria bacterium]